MVTTPYKVETAFEKRAFTLLGALTGQWPHHHIHCVCKICVLQDIIALTEDLMGLSSSKKSNSSEKSKKEENTTQSISVSLFFLFSV